jgi:hypothetical protein
LKERERWKDYMRAYEDAIRHTATPWAPWVVVPGNKKWFARIVVAATIIDALEELNLRFPRWMELSSATSSVAGSFWTARSRRSVAASGSLLRSTPASY